MGRHQLVSDTAGKNEISGSLIRVLGLVLGLGLMLVLDVYNKKSL